MCNFVQLQKLYKKATAMKGGKRAMLSLFLFRQRRRRNIWEPPEEGSKARSIPSLSRVFLSGSAAPGRAHPSAHRVCAVGACLLSLAARR